MLSSKETCSAVHLGISISSGFDGQLALLVELQEHMNNKGSYNIYIYYICIASIELWSLQPLQQLIYKMDTNVNPCLYLRADVYLISPCPQARYWSSESSKNEVHGTVLNAAGKVVHRFGGNWHEGISCDTLSSPQFIWKPSKHCPIIRL